MKIRITSLPEYKTRGYYQNDISLPALPIYQSLGIYDPNMQPFFNLPACEYHPMKSCGWQAIAKIIK